MLLLGLRMSLACPLHLTRRAVSPPCLHIPPTTAQAANLWGQGVDKLPLWGRYKWVEDHLAQIVGEPGLLLYIHTLLSSR